MPYRETALAFLDHLAEHQPRLLAVHKHQVRHTVHCMQVALNSITALRSFSHLWKVLPNFVHLLSIGHDAGHGSTVGVAVSSISLDRSLAKQGRQTKRQRRAGKDSVTRTALLRSLVGLLEIGYHRAPEGQRDAPSVPMHVFRDNAKVCCGAFVITCLILGCF